MDFSSLNKFDLMNEFDVDIHFLKFLLKYLLDSYKKMLNRH